jgi:hypothetical protein
MQQAFSVRIFTMAGRRVPLPEVVFVPQWYDAHLAGGYDQAEVCAYGDLKRLESLIDFAGNKIEILNRTGGRVWVGRIEESTLHTGSVEVGYSIKAMRNRVAVLWSDRLGNNGQTAWVEEPAGIARYGKRELIDSIADASEEAAENLRDTILARRAKPTRICRPAIDTQPLVRLACIGPVYTAEDVYYVQRAGLEENDAAGGKEQPLGQGFTSGRTGFTKSTARIHNLDGAMKYFFKDATVEISGSNANNNKSAKISAVDSRERQVYSATTISLDPIDDIMDSTGGLPMSNDDYIHFTAAPSGTYLRVYRVKQGGGNHCTLDPANIGNESAGPTFTFERGNYVECGGTTFNTEFPQAGQQITLRTHGQEVLQSFKLQHGAEPLPLAEVQVRLKRVASVNDSLLCDVYVDNAGQLGQLVESSAPLLAADCTESFRYETFRFSQSGRLTPGVQYWLRVRRSGAISAFGYWSVDVDEKVSYGLGALRLWTGTAWVARDPNASLIFRVLSVWETTKQISEILKQAQYLRGLDIRTPSGRYTNQYREGDLTLLDEIERLIEEGASGGRRLILTCSDDWWLQVSVKKEPPVFPLLRYQQDGRLMTVHGEPLVHGWLPIGEYAEIDGLPRTLAREFLGYIERASYDCLEEKLSIEFEDTQNTWDLGLRDGL